MKHASLIFAALSALMLAACGGNGGTYQGALPDHTAKLTVPDTAVHQGGAGSQPAPSQPAVQNQGIAGYYTQILPGRKAGSILLTGENNYDLNQLIINGEKISVVVPGKSGGITAIEPQAPGSTASYLMTHLDDVRYGTVVKDWQNADKRTEYLFVQGRFAPVDQLPIQDKVLVYEGKSVFSNAKGIGQGTSRFDVNFGKKTLSGKVTADGTDIPLAATIEDGQFINFSDKGAYVKGAFYGKTGEAMGGMFKSGDTVGAFGAERQE